MSFWDSSALVPTLIRESTTEQMRRLQSEDANITAWWATYVECLSALMRLLRERALTAATFGAARLSLDAMFAGIAEVPPGDEIRESAARLLTRHPLRAADALQLAAAVEWTNDRPFGREFVSLDSRLREAAQKEGFTVLP